MQKYITSLAIISLIISKANAQQLIISDKNVNINITMIDDDSISIKLKNKTNEILLISMIDGVNIEKYQKGYIGIGLYSAVYPFTPDKMLKYNGLLSLQVINPNDTFKITINSSINLYGKLMLNFDYALCSLDYFKGKNSQISRGEYDYNLYVLKYEIQ